MAIDWTAVQKKAKRQDAAYNAKATQGAANRATYQAIAKNKAAIVAQVAARNPSAYYITPTSILEQVQSGATSSEKFPLGNSISRDKYDENVRDHYAQHEISDIGNQINSMINGNIDYNKRKYITGRDMKNAGWTRPQDKNLSDSDNVTTYTVGYYGDDFDTTNPKNKFKYIELSPIRNDGTVMSPQETERYAQQLLASNDIKATDKSANGTLFNTWDNPTDAELDQFENKYAVLKQKHADMHNRLQEYKKESAAASASKAAQAQKTANYINAFQNQKESGLERAADVVSAGTSSLVGGAANAVRLATTGKYSPSGLISRGIDKIRGTNYTEQNAANQKAFADEMMDKSRLYSQNAKRGLGKLGQAGVDIGSAATQVGLMALTGNAAGALGAGSEATGALTKGLMAIQQGGQGAYDAEKAGSREGTQALYGLLQGATAYATEGISNVGALGKVFGNGVVDSKIEQASAKAISKFIKSDVGRAAANRLATGAEAGIGEALEQNIQDALTPVYQRLTYDKNAKLNAEDMIYNGLVAGAFGGIVGSAGKNNLKALETENDAKAAERRAASTAAAKAPPVTNTAPDLSQVAPNLIRPSQNIAQKATQAHTVNESAKEVKLPTETENALTEPQRAPEAKANIFPEDSLGAKITTPKSNIPLKTSENTASVQNAQSSELGAANSGFDPYSHLQNKYGNIQPGENPSRVVDVPLKTSDDMKVSQGVRTALEAKATPDEAVGPVQDAVTAERFSFETIKDKDAAARAEATVSQKGYETALRDWTADARSGKVSKDLMAQGQVLYNNAVNAGDYKTGVDILTDYVKMSRNGAQATQANRMLKKLDPQYQLYALERQTQKINEDISAKTAKQNKVGAESATAVEKAAESSINETANAIKRATDSFGSKKAARLPVDKKYSEPFTFEYEDKAGQEIGNAVEKMFQPRQAKQRTFMEDIVKEIETFAREKAPKRENKKAPLTATQRLADYIQNKDFYSDAWSNAQDYLRSKYANNPEKLKELDAFISSTIGVNGNPQAGSKIMLRSLAESAAETGETPAQLRAQEALGITNMSQRVADRLIRETGATGEDADIIRSAASQYVNRKLSDHTGDVDADKFVNAKIKSAMHDIGETVSKTTKQSGAQKQRISEAVQNMLIQKYGFDSADVSNVGDVVGKHFDAMLKAQADKQLEQIFGKKISAAQKKDLVTRFSELANMGAFDSSEYAKAATEKVFGSSGISPDPALVKEFMEAKTQEARDAVMDKLKQNVADQMPSSWRDKWNAWRYLSMLGNPRTHIRNIVGNAGFVPVREVKNIIGAGIEKATGSDRTKSVLTMKDHNLVKYALKDYSEVADSVLRNGKFNDLASDLNERRQIFKNRGLEALQKGSNKALDAEDVCFAKDTYARSLAGYYKANGITEADLASGKVPEATIDKARAYSVKEAQKATYRDSNAFSDWISSIGKYHGDNKWAKVGSTAVDAILPFRRTPANILARAWEYSPGEFLNVLGGDIRKVKAGDMDASEMIDHISSGMTGTMLLGLGAYLASQGLLTGGKSDNDDEAALATQQGYQDYALNIGGKSITLDWLAPEALPLFTGAELYKTMQQKSDGKITLQKVLTNFGNIAEPMIDMSMLQGVDDLFSSIKYSKEDNLLSIAATTAANYLSQGLPTLAGQLERVGEKERETTYVDKTSGVPTSLQYMLGKAANKIPGIEYQQRPYTDMFGQHESSGSVGERVVNNLFNPAYVRNIKQDGVTDELSRLVNGKYMSGVPDLPDQKITYGGKDNNLNKDEYTKYAEKVGQLEHKYAASMINNRVYSSMTDEQKADYLKTIISYAKDEAKRDYINKNGGKYESQMDNVYNAQQAGIEPDDFYAYKKYLKDIDPDGGNATQLQEAKAIDKTDLTTQMKGKLWQMQQSKDTKLDKNPYIGTLAQLGLAPSKTIEIMEAFDTIDDAIKKNYVKADKGPSAAQVKAAYLSQWLTRQGYNANQRAAITDVFTTWQMIPIKKISKKATAFVSANPMP